MSCCVKLFENVALKYGEKYYVVNICSKANLTQIAAGTFIPNSTSRETATVDMITCFPDIAAVAFCLTILSPCVSSTHYNDKCASQWRHNEHNGVLNHQPHDCLLNRLFRRRSKKTSKLRVSGLCVGTSPVTGDFPAKRASNAENLSIWWHHHVVSAYK